MFGYVKNSINLTGACYPYIVHWILLNVKVLLKCVLNIAR